VRFRPAKIHPEQHFRPVLCLGAACARLDVEIGVIGVHFPGEHAPEFEFLDADLETPQVALDFRHRSGIVFFDGKSKQFVGIPQPACNLIQPNDDLLEFRPLLAESLGALGFVPDVRLLQFPLDLGQPLRLLIVVKDTSSTHPRVQ
jgi:hypothetical protein